MEAPVYRPPSEAKSFLIQVTVGCSNNQCTYCAMYRSKAYRVRPFEDIASDIERAASLGVWRHHEKTFFCDGDALGAPTELLLKTAAKVRAHFPNIRRIGTYATASNILEKSIDELTELKKAGLSMAYLGMETGSEILLKKVLKGNTRAEMIEAGQKIKKAGWKISVIAMLGLGGEQWTMVHRQDTASALTEISPNFFSFLTTVPIPGTPYHRMVEKGLMKPLTVLELLIEMRDIIDRYSGGPAIFRANHVSNLFPLGGVLPKDRSVLLAQVERWIKECPADVYPDISPENM